MCHYHEESIRLLELLQDEIDADELVGETIFTLGGHSILIESRDGLGKLLEEWLGSWATLKGVDIKEDIDGTSQEFPDFFVGRDNHYLEVKAFNRDASPAFDIANFDSYCESVSHTPERLNADYLIIGYRLNGTNLSICDVWLKKIYEISGSSTVNPIKIQTKREQPYNLRPITWYSTRAIPAFGNEADFIDALYLTQEEYSPDKARINRNRFWKNVGR